MSKGAEEPSSSPAGTWTWTSCPGGRRAADAFPGVRVTNERETLFRAVLAQLGSNVGVNLLPENLDAERLSRMAADECVSPVLTVNPNLEIRAADRIALAKIYRSSYDHTREREPIHDAIVHRHIPALQTWVSACCPEKLRRVLVAAPVLGSISYAQYFPDLQLQVLGIAPAGGAGAILDMGCGAQARLVRHLQALGCDAHGVDRNVIRPGSSIQVGNWLDFDFRPGAWRLIVSHLAFSSHYLYHVAVESDHVQEYEQTYRRILASLQPGGELRYVPALPDAESELSDEQFTVATLPVSAGVQAASVTRLTEITS